MNAGLSSLTKLKQAVLPGSMRNDPSHDDTLVSLGLGVAESIETYLDRKLSWQVGDTLEMEAQRIVFGVPRYPVGAVSAVEIRRTPQGAWESILSGVSRFANASGLVCFRNAPGDESATLRVTYSGGYWWTTAEEGEEEQEMPEGATPLPSVLFTAWTMQVQAHATALKLFGTQGGDESFGAKSNLLMNAEQLIPAVAGMIKPFRRFNA